MQNFDRTIFLLCSTLLAVACSGTQPARTNTPAKTLRPLASEYFKLGQDEARAGDNLRAEQYLLAAKKAGYAEAAVLPPLLDVCLSSGRLRTALSYAIPFLQTHPDQFVLRHLVGAIYLALGDAAEAFHELQLVESQEPTFAPTKYLLGVASAEEFSDTAAAQRYFEEYLKLAPHGPHAPEALGWLREHATAHRPTAKRARS
ncbi:MAG TPA: hypothetical protein VL137_05505 [Polyangiaceae bacterium]|nr:hypothetical protein [Polyangiaceae bacterium]